ncbi:leukocyte elastase inhibitor-like isoform X1 [Platichthys flesus]|uniref:leukocyte elastase inhibitor-like isoform X1 n=2 Tax=Platichthys flesus TaxID=8260 RepID=UPI002DB77196|nr:leukocyte elastase inhibitor-like isoform X1 [Platichthys flesus]XP_062242428.1 leukocyte elastase inhibitor-like isoform X1 [Platichthys flesus]
MVAVSLQQTTPSSSSSGAIKPSPSSSSDNCTSSAMGNHSVHHNFHGNNPGVVHFSSPVDIPDDVPLYRTLSHANPSGNMFLSPLSINSALAMVYLGARGETAFQMEKVLAFEPGEEVHAAFKKLIAEINSPSASYILKTANRLYGEKTTKFIPPFLEAIGKYYKDNLKTVDFIGAAEASRGEINTWVEKQTENKIKDLLKAVSDGTRLALVNAIYFKGNWMYRFDEANTKEMPFKVSQTVSKPVQMMFQKKNLHYNSIDGLQILELPYEKEELSMLILLPAQSTDGSDPLLKLEEELTLEMLNGLTDRENMLVHSDIHVHLPKFKMEVEYKLNEPLSEMGMTDVFCPSKADLSGMNDGRDLFLSTVVHKAFVEVNEEGKEAAAATPAVVPQGGPNLKEEHFTADHPFLFFIRHNKTKSLLFLGKFSSPQ